MSKVCTSYCKPCVYSRWSHHCNLLCDYIGVTGQRRGCPPGDGCEKRVIGERKVNVETMIYKGRKL